MHGIKNEPTMGMFAILISCNVNACKQILHESSEDSVISRAVSVQVCFVGLHVYMHTGYKITK